MRRFFLSILILLSLSGEGYALDIIGTGSNQGEALHQALQNLSEIVSGVRINTHITMDKRMTGDDYSADVKDFFTADSEFFVSNIQRHIAELAERRVVIRLSRSDIDQLRERYFEWKRRPDVSGNVTVSGGKAVVTFREAAGCPVTVRSVTLIVETSKVSMLCSGWTERAPSRSYELLAKPVNLADGKVYEISADLGGGFNVLDLGKRTEHKMTAFIRGIDGLGREFKKTIRQPI